MLKIPCERCGEIPTLTLPNENQRSTSIRCKCGMIAMHNDPTGKKVFTEWLRSRRNTGSTHLDWIKNEATADQIVEFFSQICTLQAKASYCEQFDNCHDCKVAWLNSKREE